MQRLRTVSLGLALALTMIPSAQAALFAGFDGSFGAFTTTGDTSIQTNLSLGVAPVQGSGQALLTTYATSGDGDTVSGTSAVSVTSLGAFLGAGYTAALQAQGVTQGSAIATTLFLSAGDTLQFNWSFLTSEPGTSFGGQSDLAFFVFSPVPTGLTNLANATNADTLPGSGAFFFDSETGYALRTLTAFTSGTYTLAFGVADVVNNGTASGLLVDNIVVTAAAIPEPMTLLGFGLGVAGLLTQRKRR